MSEFRRFSDGEADDPARALFRSMREDAPAPGRKGDVLAAALAAAATVTAATSATAAVGAVASAQAAQVPVAAAVASTAAPAAVLPVAAATAAPVAAGLVPGVSIVKMIGAFVLGGAVTATGLVAGTQLLDPPPAAAPRPVVTATTPATTSIAAPVAAKPSGPREEGNHVDEVAPPIESARAVPSAAPVVVPSARAERAERPGLEEPSPAAPAAVASVVTPPEPTLADEVSSLDAARRALSSGDGPGALRALDVFQGKFPRARLGTEALVLRVEALVASGRVSDARGLGEPFLSAHPDSPFAPRVRRAIGQKANVLTIP